MPPKKAAPKADVQVAAVEAKPAAAEGTRRSSRIAEKPAPPAPPPKKPAAPRKKRAAEKTDEDKQEEPAPKKAKQDDDAADDAAAETSTKKPESKAEKPASKAEKPASKAAKPESSAKKPASKAGNKPASKAKPSSKAKAAAEGAADDKHPETIPEEKEDVVMEDKENAKEAGPSGAADESKLKIDIGDTLPAWTFKNEKDQEIDVSKIAGERGVVIFAVPKADTPGCTKQACGFRDNFEEFEKHGYVVYGLSADAVAAQAKWQTKNELSYPLISDPSRKLIGALGAKAGSKTTRSHFIFEKGTGKLIEKKVPVKPEESPKQALAFVEKHHSS